MTSGQVGDLKAAVAITLLINSRHLLMGAALAPHLKHLPKRRALPALFLMCDESWAMGPSDARQDWWMRMGACTLRPRQAFW